MSEKIELLAPGGNVDAVKAAILAGADAVFCGLNKFNARNRAANIGFDDLLGLLNLAHKHDCKIFLTLNIVVLDSEIPALVKLLNRLVNTRIDGVIVQDLGLFYLLKTYFPTLCIHASTQMTTHNEGQIKFIRQLGAERVNLSRELSLSEISDLTSSAHSNGVEVEVFVHGSYCISFSGLCYISSLHGGNSGNRGRCSQPCRDKYQTTAVGKDFPLNLKDNSAFFDLEQLHEAGVDSLKIEGRIKESDYVFTTVDAWRKQLTKFYAKQPLLQDKSALYTVFNRDFSNAFLKGDIDKDLFIDSPSSHSTKYFTEANNGGAKAPLLVSTQQLFREKEELKANLQKAIAAYDISKEALQFVFSGTCGEPLTLKVTGKQVSCFIQSHQSLSDEGAEPLSVEMLQRRFKTVNDTEYTIAEMHLELEGDLYLPFKRLNQMKKELLFKLNHSIALKPEVTLPKLKRSTAAQQAAGLSVLISSVDDVPLCDDSSLDVFFQLPSCIGDQLEEYIALFRENKQLIPWFPAVLIGDDFAKAVDLLNALTSEYVVSNNTGIAFEAHKMGMPWIAGPHLNVMNSYALLSLKDEQGCKGAFLSNEMSQQQIAGVRTPEDFELYFSIFHPIELMTSRQCLFHQTSGCHKEKLDDRCISSCHKRTTITNMKNEVFFIQKTPGNYHQVFNNSYLLNTEVVKKHKGLFSHYMLDLRQIESDTKVTLSQSDLIATFKMLLLGDAEASDVLHAKICPSNNTQYTKGI